MSQLTLPTFDSYLTDLLSMKHNTLGAWGEQIALTAFEQAGYSVAHHIDRVGDMRVRDSHGELFRVEVKTARADHQFKWRFTVYHPPFCSHRDADLVLLLAAAQYVGFVPFLIPVSVIYDLQRVAIGSHPLKYAGKYSPFRQDMSALSIDRALGIAQRGKERGLWLQ